MLFYFLWLILLFGGSRIMVEQVYILKKHIMRCIAAAALYTLCLECSVLATSKLWHSHLFY